MRLISGEYRFAMGQSFRRKKVQVAFGGDWSDRTPRASDAIASGISELYELPRNRCAAEKLFACGFAGGRLGRRLLLYEPRARGLLHARHNSGLGDPDGILFVPDVAAAQILAHEVLVARIGDEIDLGIV